MYYLIQSNQGNHTGLNRKWTLLQRSESLETLTDKLKSIIYNSSDNHSVDEQGNVTDENGNLRYEHGSTGAEYDLLYYYIFSEEEAERFQYDTGHYSGVYDLIENSSKEAQLP